MSSFDCHFALSARTPQLSNSSSNYLVVSSQSLRYRLQSGKPLKSRAVAGCALIRQNACKLPAFNFACVCAGVCLATATSGTTRFLPTTETKGIVKWTFLIILLPTPKSSVGTARCKLCILGICCNGSDGSSVACQRLHHATRFNIVTVDISPYINISAIVGVSIPPTNVVVVVVISLVLLLLHSHPLSIFCSK